jgi:hypothetical protein
MLNADHLIDLAEIESNPDGAGAPRQVVLRRAASTAYYATFHALLGQVAEAFVPATQWKSRVLFYRALEHRKTRDRCKRAGQSPLPKEEFDFFGTQGFAPEVRSFANGFVRLHELRNRCDYDPDFRIVKDQAQQAVEAARQAISDLRATSPADRVPFLSYLLFGIRG